MIPRASITRGPRSSLRLGRQRFTPSVGVPRDGRPRGATAHVSALTPLHSRRAEVEDADPRHFPVTGVYETRLAVVMGSLPRAARPQDEATRSCSSSCPRQCERHGVVAVARAERTMTACGDDDILAPIAPPIGHRRRLRAGWQPCLPHHLAGPEIERAQILVGRGADEHEAARGDDRPAQVGHAGLDRDAEMRAEQTRIARGAQHFPPQHLARLQVDGGQVSPRRRDARCAEDADPRLHDRHVRRVVLRLELRLHRVLSALLLRHQRPDARIVAAHQPQLERHLHRVDGHGAADRIDRRTAPVGDAVERGMADDRLQPDRLVDACALRSADVDAAHQLVYRRRAPCGLLGRCGRRERRHSDRERLRRRHRHPRRRAVGPHWALSDRSERRAVQTVEEIHLAHLGRLDERGDDATVGCAIVKERRPYRQIHVPHVVVDELAHPAQLACSDVQRDDSGAEAVVERPAIPDPVVWRSIAGAEIDDPVGGIRGDRPPDIRRAARVVLAGGQRRDRVLRAAHVPGPDRTARHRVVGAHDAARNVAIDIVDDPLADDQAVVDDHRRGGRDLVGGRRDAHVRSQVDRSAIGEARARPTRVGVERDQPGVKGRREDATRARRASGRLVVDDAAAHEIVVALDLGVLVPAPLRPARRRVDRLDERVRRAGVERVADMDRGRLGMIFAQMLLGLRGHRQVACALRPGEFELADVGRRDVAERRIAATRQRAAVIAPVAVRLSGRRWRGAGGGRRVSRGRILAMQEKAAGEHERGDRRGGRHHVRTDRAATASKTGQQDENEQDRRCDHSRHELEPVEADLPHRPDQRTDPDRDEDAAARGIAAADQRTARDHRETGDEIIGRPAVRHQHAACDDEEAPERRDDPR